MSIVEQLDAPRALRDHVGRLRGLERSGVLWIVVGTLGLDGVDSLLTPDSPPFVNGWTQALGITKPYAFSIQNGWVHLRGGIAGGADGTTIFTLPEGFRPSSLEREGPFVIGTQSVSHYATYYVEPTGDVVFGTVV